VAKSCAAEAAFSLERSYEQIAHGPLSGTGLQYVEGLGWTLQAEQEARGYFHESGASNTSIILPGAGAQCASLISVVPRSRRQTQYGPMTGGYPADYPTTGGAPGLQMSVPAGTTSPSSLTADDAAFPGPTQSSNRVPLDRILVSTEPHEPDQPLFLNFEVSAGFIGAELLRLYFSGPAGSRPDWLGLGQYCLLLVYPYSVVLFEKGRAPGETMDRWQRQWVGPCAQALQSIGSKVFISVRCDVRKQPTGYRGHRILVQVGAAGEESGGDSGLAKGQSTLKTLVYRLRNTADDRMTQVEKIRLDCRRDLRVWMQLSRPVFPASATLQDQPIHLPFIANAGTAVGLEWYGHIPSGCDIDATLFDADTGTALTPTSSRTAIGAFGFFRTYALPAGVRRLYASYTLSSNGQKAPVLTVTRLFKDAVNRLDSGSEVVMDVTRVEVQGASDNPDSEYGTVEFHDLRGQAAALLQRGAVPFVLETDFNGQTAVLHAGYARGQAMRKGGPGPHGQAMGDSRWRHWTLSTESESARLSTPLTNYNINIGFDPDASAVAGYPVAFKVTDVIWKLLHDAGYLSSDLDIPDLSLRFWNVRSEDVRLDWTQDPLTLVRQLCEDYLGMFLIRDPNAGSTGRGMWRLRGYPRSPYRPLVQFFTSAPAGVGKVVTDERRWAGLTANLPDGQPVLSTWIERGTLHEQIVPPEANHVIVYAPAASGAQTGDAPDGYIVGECYNFKSAQFWSGQPISPDPTSMDYLGSATPLIHIDPHLATPEAVAWVARRIYRRVAHGHKRLVFRAPLMLVTDISDTLETHPRPLRYGDSVLVDGVDFLVRSVRMEIDAERGGDTAQMAYYEVRTPPPLEEEIPMSLVQDEEDIGV